MGPPRRSRNNVIERDAGWQAPDKLKESVRSLALLWSRDEQGAREDLEQAALPQMWLKGKTEADLSHQIRTAQNWMLSVRKLGKSVDGKLDGTNKRATPYVLPPGNNESRAFVNLGMPSVSRGES